MLGTGFQELLGLEFEDRKDREVALSDPTWFYDAARKDVHAWAGSAGLHGHGGVDGETATWDLLAKLKKKRARAHRSDPLLPRSILPPCATKFAWRTTRSNV